MRGGHASIICIVPLVNGRSPKGIRADSTTKTGCSNYPAGPCVACGQDLSLGRFSDGRACIDISARVILYIPSSSFVYVFQVNVRNVGR